MYLVGLLIFIVIIPRKFIHTEYVSKDWDKKYNLNKYRRDDSRNWRVNVKLVLGRFINVGTEFK
jgi:hypothetical protein